MTDTLDSSRRETHRTIFLTDVNLLHGTAEFHVYTYQAGKWHQSRTIVTPGDPILHAEGQILLDLVDTPNGICALLCSSDGGRISRRYLEQDREHPDRFKLELELYEQNEVQIADTPSTTSAN